MTTPNPDRIVEHTRFAFLYGLDHTPEDLANAAEVVLRLTDDERNTT